MGWAYGDYAATLVRPDSPYKEMADLKGKKIGTVVGSGSYMAWLIWLDSQGMSVNDFQIVNMQGGEVAGALSSGVIDGATIWEPYPAMMEHRKIGKIIALYAKVVYDAVVIQTRREVIEKKTRFARPFRRGPPWTSRIGSRPIPSKQPSWLQKA
jgi:ABC-type nitrate/sulfonate/bicarbonate transport system substrate-binding protein